MDSLHKMLVEILPVEILHLVLYGSYVIILCKIEQIAASWSVLLAAVC